MTTIDVFHDYSGRRTAERPIYAGVYDATDPALYSLAEYLVANGHARVMDEPELDSETPIEQDAEPVVEASPYDNLTVAELKDEIDKRDIDLKDGAGSGSKGAWVRADLVGVLVSDDESKAE